MKALAEDFKRDAAYWGERGGWLMAYAIHRDSDALARSNWRCFLNALGGESETVAIEEASHWAVGWIRYLVIHPEDKERIALAESIIEKLEDYPVIDESDWSEEEQKEAEEVWQNCYRASERIKYIREHRNQFEFGSFADLLGCVRGKYFAGYASELLH